MSRGPGRGPNPRVWKTGKAHRFVDDPTPLDHRRNQDRRLVETAREARRLAEVVTPRPATAADDVQALAVIREPRLVLDVRPARVKTGAKLPLDPPTAAGNAAHTYARTWRASRARATTRPLAWPTPGSPDGAAGSGRDDDRGPRRLLPVQRLRLRLPGSPSLPGPGQGQGAGQQRGHHERPHLKLGWGLTNPGGTAEEGRSRRPHPDPQRLQPWQPPCC
jgi:hypothetical protein